MTPGFALLPNPRKTINNTGAFQIRDAQTILFTQPVSEALTHAAERLSEDVKTFSRRSWQATGNATIPEKDIAVQISLDPQRISHAQGYSLVITPKRITLTGNDEPGVFYGIQTLRQIVCQSKGDLPCMEIVDWPDFPVRGVLLDISRDKVYRMETLFMLVDELASWKVNQLQLYTEHTFAYQGHEVVWRDASPMTPEEVKTLDAFCRERFIELVPNQNSLGHMNRWLKHPQYRHLAETTEPVRAPWGELKTDPFSLAPVLPESLAFITGLYDRLLPNFTSRTINSGCDEAFDIGAGQSRAACEEKGTGQVYLDYLLALHQVLTDRGYTIQFWGDILLQHPELVPLLPKDMIALDWGYEANHPFAEETQVFQSAGIPFYVCPGTSSWNSLGGRIENMLANCRNAAVQGLMNDAAGYLNTDWGDNGHWQQLPISYPGFTAGAAFSWCLQSNNPLDLERVLNTIVFRDKSQAIGGIMIAIGNEYRSWGLHTPNSSPLFWLLQMKAEEIKQFKIDDIALVNQSMKRLDTALEELEEIRPARSDAQQIHDEIKLTIQLMKHACKRCLWLFEGNSEAQSSALLREIKELTADYRRLWEVRNRTGGLSDSLARFDPLLREYQTEHE